MDQPPDKQSLEFEFGVIWRDLVVGGCWLDVGGARCDPQSSRANGKNHKANENKSKQQEQATSNNTPLQLAGLQEQETGNHHLLKSRIIRSAHDQH